MSSISIQHWEPNNASSTQSRVRGTGVQKNIKKKDIYHVLLLELVNPALPTYLLHPVLLQLVLPAAYRTSGHGRGRVADCPAHQITRRCDGEVHGDHRSRHQKGPGPYRD